MNQSRAYIPPSERKWRLKEKLLLRKFSKEFPEKMHPNYWINKDKV